MFYKPNISKDNALVSIVRDKPATLLLQGMYMTTDTSSYKERLTADEKSISGFNQWKMDCCRNCGNCTVRGKAVNEWRSMQTPHAGVLCKTCNKSRTSIERSTSLHCDLNFQSVLLKRAHVHFSPKSYLWIRMTEINLKRKLIFMCKSRTVQRHFTTTIENQHWW